MLGEVGADRRTMPRAVLREVSRGHLEVGRHARPDQDITARHSISVKLLGASSARYELAQKDRVMKELCAASARTGAARAGVGIGLTVDAEEAERLELSLLLIDSVLASDLLNGYAGFGLAVQAYQRRAYNVLEWLAARTRQNKRKI